MNINLKIFKNSYSIFHLLLGNDLLMLLLKVLILPIGLWEFKF